MDWDLFQVKFRKTKKCFLICHTYLWIKDKPSSRGENTQNNKPKMYVSFINCQKKLEAAERKAQCYMRQSVVNICTILVLFSTWCDVMSLLNKGYSENGTNVKVNKNYWLKIKSVVLLYNINSEPQHIMQVIVEF